MATPTTRCKFHCNSITLSEYGAKVVKLSAVMPRSDGSEGFTHGEDHSFWSATPQGSIELTIMNPAGADLFQPGDDFYVDLTKVEKVDVPSA